MYHCPNCKQKIKTSDIRKLFVWPKTVICPNCKYQSKLNIWPEMILITDLFLVAFSIIFFRTKIVEIPLLEILIYVMILVSQFIYIKNTKLIPQ